MMIWYIQESWFHHILIGQCLQGTGRMVREMQRLTRLVAVGDVHKTTWMIDGCQQERSGEAR